MAGAVSRGGDLSRSPGVEGAAGSGWQSSSRDREAGRRERRISATRERERRQQQPPAHVDVGLAVISDNSCLRQIAGFSPCTLEPSIDPTCCFSLFSTVRSFQSNSPFQGASARSSTHHTPFSTLIHLFFRLSVQPIQQR